MIVAKPQGHIAYSITDYQVCEVMTTRYGWVDTGECEILRILRTERHTTNKEGVDSTLVLCLRTSSFILFSLYYCYYLVIIFILLLLLLLQRFLSLFSLCY